MKYLVFVFCLFWSCAKREPENLVSKEEAIYQVSDIDLPKHASVTLTNMTTKMVFKDVYLGKHCSDLHFWSEGNMITLNRYSYQQGSVITEDFSYSELRLKFCQ